MQLQDPTLWIAAGAALIVGLLLGLAFGRRGGKSAARVHELETELEASREEISRYREQVADHFTETSRLLRDLTLQYRGVYEHLADGARNLCPEGAVELAPSLADAALPATAEEEAPDREPEPASEPVAASEAAAPAEASEAAPDAEAAPAPAGDELEPILESESERLAGSPVQERPAAS